MLVSKGNFDANPNKCLQRQPIIRCIEHRNKHRSFSLH